MLVQAVCDYWTEFLYFNRAKFAIAFVNGIRVSYSNNCIAKHTQQKHLYPPFIALR